MTKYGTRVLGKKHQFYQFGFNDENSCWLNGKWVTVTKERYEAEREAQETAHARALDEMKRQNHHDKRTPVASMTPEQRQAWEFFSGTAVLECVYSNGNCGPVRVEMSGGAVTGSSIKWLKFRAAKVARRCAIGENKPYKQDLPGLPPDMYAEGTLDPAKWKFTPD